MDNQNDKVLAKEPEASLVDSFNKTSTSIFTAKFFVILGLVLVVGVGSGYALSITRGNVGSDTKKGSEKTPSTSNKIVGSSDIKTFKDTATGTLKGGGIDGEGAYHLVRPGGESQNVYLTSSILDLSQFIGKKVKVWGETQKAKIAGWLMDVGRVEVLQ